MARCPSCDYPLPENRERMGARCPSCRDPLYEPPGRFGRPVRAGEASCTLHTTNESIGTCTRCGNFYCEICRCNWRGQLQCIACVERALDSGDGSTEKDRTHFRQALRSLVLGLFAWVPAGLLLLGAMLLAAAASSDKTGPPNQALMFLSGLCSLGIFGLAVVALFGVGQGAAALRTRGNHMILANFGLILSGLYVGVLVGFVGLRIWSFLL
jgi:hypothetical protein